MQIPPPPEELGIRGPPLGVKGMTELDRDAFSLKAVFPALEIDMTWMQTLYKPLKHVRFMHKKFETVRPIPPPPEGKDEVEAESSTRKLMLLDPEVAPDFDSLVAAMKTKSVSSFLDRFKITREHFRFEVVQLHYADFTSDTVLTWILPDEVGPVTGFSQCGHIVHLNLKEHHLPFKKLIAQVLLDNVRAARTVVNKTTEIHHVYRNFEFEVGERE